MIACLQIAPFATAIERPFLPELEAAPLALALTQTIHVHAACERAARAGVRVGMPLREAYALCPGLRVQPAHPATYQEVRGQIATLVQQCSDEIELDGDDGQLLCFADLGPLRRADAIATAQELGREVRRQTALAPAIGIATRGRFRAATIASRTRENHIRLLQTTAAQALIAAQPLSALGMPDWMQAQLARLGWHTIGEFAALPPGSVSERFGAEGVRLHRLARGEGEAPLRRRLPAPHVSVSYRAETPLASRMQLEAVIPQLSEQLALELAAYRQRAGTLWIRVRQEDRQLQERRRTLRHPVVAPSQLDHALAQLVRQVRVTAGVVELTALASDLQAREVGSEQLTLWEQSRTSFQEVVPFLRRRYGADRLWQVRLNEEATSPTQAVRFIPLNGEADKA